MRFVFAIAAHFSYDERSIAKPFRNKIKDPPLRILGVGPDGVKYLQIILYAMEC